MKFRFSLILYIIFLHLYIGVTLYKTDIIEQMFSRLGMEVSSSKVSHYYQTMLIIQKRIDANVQDGSVIFIGDSLVQGLAVSAIAPGSVNFGIGHDTTSGVLNRLGEYTSINRSRFVVLAIGINDLNKRSIREILQNYEMLINRIPRKVPILISAVLPVDEVLSNKQNMNRRIVDLNKNLEKICDKDNRLMFLNIGPYISDKHGSLSAEYHIGDGVHLNKSGYYIWIEKLKGIINNYPDSIQ